MDCIDLFKKAAAAMQTDPRYLELDAARRENDNDQELQGLIGEFNLKRLDLNNESAKPEPDTAHVADLNQQVNDLYTQIMSSEGMVRYNTAKKECEAMVSHIDAIINTAMNGGAIMKGWTNDERTMIACCNDGTRHVIFRIERID